MVVGWPLAGRDATGQGHMPGTTKQDHQAERLQAIRLRYTINTHLEDQGFATPAGVERHAKKLQIRRILMGTEEG